MLRRAACWARGHREGAVPGRERVCRTRVWLRTASPPMLPVTCFGTDPLFDWLNIMTASFSPFAHICPFVT